MANNSTELTTSSGWTLYHISTSKEYSLICLSINIFIIVSNILVILVFSKMRKLQLQHYFMLGLVCSDLMIFFQNSIIIAFLVMGKVWMNDALCFTLGSASISAASATSLIHSAMAMDRWISITFPFEYGIFKQKPRSKKIVIATIISIYIVPCALMYLTWQTNQVKFYFDIYVPYCIADVGEDGAWGLIVASVLSIAIPCVVQVFTNAAIIYKIAKADVVGRKRVFRAVRTVLTTLAVYYMCWLPMGVWTMWDFVSTTHPAGSPDWLGYFAVQMMVLNSGMCFLIYYNTLTRFKMTFQLNKVFGVTSGTTQTTASSQQPLQGFVSRRAWGSEL